MPELDQNLPGYSGSGVEPGIWSCGCWGSRAESGTQAAGGQRRLAAGSLLVPVPGGLGPAALLRFSTVSMQVMSRTCGLCSVLVTR